MEKRIRTNVRNTTVNTIAYVLVGIIDGDDENDVRRSDSEAKNVARTLRSRQSRPFAG